jgi:hypothetical protein
MDCLLFVCSSVVKCYLCDIIMLSCGDAMRKCKKTAIDPRRAARGCRTRRQVLPGGAGVPQPAFSRLVWPDQHQTRSSPPPFPQGSPTVPPPFPHRSPKVTNPVQVAIGFGGIGGLRNIQTPTSGLQHLMLARGPTFGCSMLDVGGWMFERIPPRHLAYAAGTMARTSLGSSCQPSICCLMSIAIFDSAEGLPYLAS